MLCAFATLFLVAALKTVPNTAFIKRNNVRADFVQVERVEGVIEQQQAVLARSRGSGRTVQSLAPDTRGARAG